MPERYKTPHYKQYMPQDQLDQLRARAKKTGMPMQQIVRLAVAEWLVRHQPKPTSYLAPVSTVRPSDYD
jgi:Ribbon-helix-helix protein, copG family